MNSEIKHITSKYRVVIGLEVHIQLKTSTKSFCRCPVEYGSEPNKNTCPVCLGYPGVLPVLNENVVVMAVKLGHALNCEIHLNSRFARKNYFYPDLAKGYQITQAEYPICTGGLVPLDYENKEKVALTRIHIEEDAGKSFHKNNSTLVDFNRAGIPLLEIVSEPEIRSPKAAEIYLNQLRRIVRYLDICDGDMEKGSLRCDANISLNLINADEFGTRAEIKNLNSKRFVRLALEHEIKRQFEILEIGSLVEQETRLWNEKTHQTNSMRSKEESHDYRYFPEPDLPELKISENYVNEISKNLPELPTEKYNRFIRQYEISSDIVSILINEKQLADYFEETISFLPAEIHARTVANWIQGEVLRLLKHDNLSIENFSIKPQKLAQLITMSENGIISKSAAKQVFEEMIRSGHEAGDIVKRLNLKMEESSSILVQYINEVLKQNPDIVDSYKGGKTKVFGALMGQAMKLSQGKANPRLLKELLQEALDKL